MTDDVCRRLQAHVDFLAETGRKEASVPFDDLNDAVGELERLATANRAMNPEQALTAANRVIAFLEECEERDIEAGIGYILGVWPEGRIQRFRELLAAAIRGEDRQDQNKSPAQTDDPKRAPMA